MQAELPHISVCICTYKRPQLLKRLLEALARQQTDQLFTYSVLVVDNDRGRSGEIIVTACSATFTGPIRYFVEPARGISLARNMAVMMATGQYIALIDDDEFPGERWLVTLLGVCDQFGVDGALGPVMPYFDARPPRWVVKGSFYERPNLDTGTRLRWCDCRTGNALLRKSVFDEERQPFRPELRGGEDRDFFRRKIEQGRQFIWCRDAVVHEVVPPRRWTRRFMLRRALLRGAVAAVSHKAEPVEILKSVAAVAIYVVALPPALLLGQHRFMNISIRLFDHVGKLLALVGLNPVHEPYVSE